MKAILLCLSMGLMLTSLTAKANKIYFPIYSQWEQPDGLGSDITLTYSYSNLLNNNLLDFYTGKPIPPSNLRGAIEAAMWDYANILPIHFVEISDYGPLPETGEYDPTALADIRMGQVTHIDNANAYAYFPFQDSGLAGDIVFNTKRFGMDWTLSIFYGVAQHELGHSLGMGHALDIKPSNQINGNSAISTQYTGPLFPLSKEMITALQNTYGVGTGSVTPIPLSPAFILFLTAIGLLKLKTREES